MKYFFTLLLGITVLNANAQINFTKYYDSTDIPTTKENARYYTEFVKQDSEYIATSYYLPSKKIFGKANYDLDTVITQSKGLSLKYYENGNLKYSRLSTYKGKGIYSYSYYESGKMEDSTVYGKDWNDYDTYSFSENGKLIGHTYFDNQSQTDISLGFNEAGEIIPGYIYYKKPEFPGGMRGWQQYLVKNLNIGLPSDNGAKNGKYSVTLSFQVDVLGNISNVQAENNPGYGTREEAIRVIKKSPAWVPAIKKNVPTAFRHRQSITFLVSDN